MNEDKIRESDTEENENIEMSNGKIFPDLENFQPKKSYKTVSSLVTCFFICSVAGAIVAAAIVSGAIEGSTTGYIILATILFIIAGIMPILILMNFIFTAYQFFNKTTEQNNEIIEMLDDYFYEEDEDKNN